ncbi:MAG: NYN domain-containing protein [Selenomonadaceae bacterium]|nr:NYN domain-containing protein [Selenomonadaceae bacterium]
MSKQPPHYLVDGYNLMHAWEELRGEELYIARDRLTNWLIEYGGYEKFDITLVFDAAFTDDEEKIEEHNEHFRVIYTASGESADKVIERLTYDLIRRKREVHVVSSDAVIETVILGASAYRHPSREFCRAVKRAKKQLRQEYLGNVTLPLVRAEVGDRIDQSVFDKLDRLRRQK